MTNEGSIHTPSLLAVLCVSFPTSARASVIVTGGLGNFDCTNNTGQQENEFEIELKSLDPTSIQSLWSNSPTYRGSGYGLPTVSMGPSSDGIAGHTSTYVDYKHSGISTPVDFVEHFGIHFVDPSFNPPSTLYTG